MTSPSRRTFIAAAGASSATLALGLAQPAYAADLSAYYPLLAYHWVMAAEAYEEHPELTDRAIDYLERAGEQALNNFANQEAARFFSQALALDARRRGAVRGDRRAVFTDRRLAARLAETAAGGQR